MNKRDTTETVIQQKTSTFPIIALLLANLLAVLLTMGILLVRTKRLVNSSAKITPDRIGEIKLDNGIVTFDLMDLEAATNSPKVTHQVIMKDQDFLEGFSQMEGLVRKMQKAGLIKTNAPGVQGAGAQSPSE